MTDEQLIANQARQIAKLEEKANAFGEALKQIRGMIVCIGGPLNDNKLKYSNEQRVIFAEIVEQSEVEYYWTDK